MCGMKRRAFLAGASALAAALPLAGCGVLTNPTPDYRYRLTVEVDTPEGLKTGSSVIEVRTWNSPGEVRHKLTGEAVAVDLGPRGLLFALLRSEQNPDWAKTIMFLLSPDVPYVKGEDQFLKRFSLMLNMRGRTLEVPRLLPRIYPPDPQPSGFPMLVRFRNINDPMSIEQVDPDDLAKTFGDDIKIKCITVSLTDESVTLGIEKRLRWFDNMNVYRTDPDNPFSNTLPSALGYLRKVSI